MKNRFLLFFFLAYSGYVFADHTAGGEVWYEYVGSGAVSNSNRYKLNIIIYDNCNTGSGIWLPSTVFKEQEPFEETFFLSLDYISFIDPPLIECSTLPSGICMRKRQYSKEIDLPITSESYFFVYQNCCRSDDLENIFNSGETGYSYMVEITPDAQQLFNSSPSFVDLPPTVICVNQPLNIPIEASDNDGDQLIYSLCAPNKSVDTVGVSTPYPPPPYSTVNFIAPEYAPQQPLGQLANLSLDSNTGLLIGIPKLVGKFVVGVCVQEYRNGQLLSTIIRDFQFNVAPCTPHAQINIENALLDMDDALVLNFCNTNEVAIQNTSLDTNFIDQFYWTFDFSNNTDTIYDWHPNLSLSESGIYTGQLFLNPGEECSDSADIIINVNTDLNANFEFSYDTCIGGEVDFSNTAFSEGGDIINWDWDFGDNAQSQLEAPQHLYQMPGTQETTLIVTNEFGCKDTVTKVFEWLPAPPIIVVAPNTFAGCSPLSVYFENLSSPIDSTYEILWDFGNGDFSTNISPSYTYDDNGVYDIEVSITSPIGCSIDTFFSELITVEPPPIANFDWQPKEVTNFSPEVIFTNFSNRAEAWEWKFNEISESFSQQANYIFPDTGIQSITLIVTDQYGCRDSISQWLDVVPKTSYFLPNAFTPNQDSKNEIYLGKGVLEGVTDFQMNIWNRWGELVFTSKDPYVGWDGKHIRTGRTVKEGVYICTVKYQTSRGEMFEFKQSLALIK